MTDWLDRELDTMVAPRRDSKSWRKQVTTWRQFLAQLGNPADHKECGNYVLGRFKGEYRRKNTILGRSGLALDADYVGDVDTFLGAVRRVLRGAPWAGYSTWRSTPSEPRLRLILPISRELTPDEYRHVTESLMTQIGRSYFDPGSSEPERYMFLPSTQSAATYLQFEENLDSDPLDVDDFLMDFAEDLSGEDVPGNKLRFKRNPFEIDGVIGAFNRAYSIPEAIEAFELPYEPSGDRWHLVGARAIAGMAEVGDGLAYSHHATDPAFGVACNAFDLCRLHLFGDLDDIDSVKDDTPVNKLPSHKAMLELASTDAKVVRELVGLDFADELAAFADEETADAEATTSHNWVDQLRIVAATGAVEDCVQNWELIVKHDPLFSSIAHNRLTATDDFTVRPPWAPPGRYFDPVIGKPDLVELKGHIEKRYRVKLYLSQVEELVLKAATSRSFHPIIDYLDALPTWDGVPRVETFLPTTPSDYTRMVSRKALVASVARMYDPGVKWDHVVMLRGGEGIGKSTCVDMLYRGFSAPLGPLGKKDTVMICHRSWAVVADEAYVLTRADKEQLKEFVTLRSDVYRTPYDRHPRSVPRSFTFWATTNDQKFLIATEGNRRYLPIECDTEVDWELLRDQNYIDQVWAEAKHYYREGEVLYITAEENAVARAFREQFTEEEPLVGLVERYVNTLVPKTWPEMSPEARVQWMMDLDDGVVPPGTERIEEVCSVQVWVEVLRRRRGEHKRGDLIDITRALRKLPGWAERPGRRHTKSYGTQLLFMRTDRTQLEDIL